MKVVTIGVYGWTLDSFLDALREADVRLVARRAPAARRARQRVRVGEREAARRRRSTRPGSRTSTTRSSRRRPSCASCSTARTTATGVGKRSRTELAPEYVERYTRDILGQVDLRPLVDELPDDGAAALLCVERDPEACHRSLVAERLEHEHGVAVTHLRP